MLRRSAPSSLSEDGCFVTLVRSNRFKPDVVGHVGNPWRQLRPHQPRKSVTNTIAAHVADDKARLIVVRERRIAVRNQLPVKGLDGVRLAEPCLDCSDDLVERISEERRAGKECVSTVRSRWWP